jgi:YD repeat-containing protein
VPSAVTPTYDDDGNMLTDGTGKSYQWDCENRLIQVTLPTGEVVKYHYDADGRRIKREHTTQTLNDITIYLYDDWNVIYEPNQKSQTADNEITSIAKSYIWGLDLSDALQGAGSVGGLLATKTINFGSTQFCFHTYDANGTLSIPVKWSYNIPKKIPGLQSTSDSAWGKNGITWNLFAKSQWTKEQVPIDVNNGGDFLITITWDNCCGNDVFAVKVNRNFSIKKKRFGSIKERDDAAQWRAQGR